jgi:hypothetical protein
MALKRAAGEPRIAVKTMPRESVPASTMRLESTPFERMFDLPLSVEAPIAIEHDDDWCQRAMGAYWEHRHSEYSRGAHRDAFGHLGPLLQVVGAEEHCAVSSLELNNKTMRNFLAVDIDVKSGDVRYEVLRRIALCPVVPTCVVLSPHGGHAIFAIDPVTRVHDKSEQFALDCQVNLRLAMDGDAAYAAHTSRNPVFLGARTLWGPSAQLGLKDIRAAFGSGWQQVNRFARGANAGEVGDGRNSSMFDQLNALSRIQPSADLGDAGLRINSTFDDPLDDEELGRVVKSVQRRARTRGKGSATLVSLGRRGGSARSELKVASSTKNLQIANQAMVQRTEGRTESVRRLLSEGWSKPAIAEHLGISERTVSRHAHKLVMAEDLGDVAQLYWMVETQMAA